MPWLTARKQEAIHAAAQGAATSLSRLGRTHDKHGPAGPCRKTWARWPSRDNMQKIAGMCLVRA
jgi:hypothetical protein